MIADTSTYTDFQGLSALRTEAKTQSPDAIKKVARQFESLFVQMMLKSMRDTMPEDGLFNSRQQRMYQDMYDKQISLNISDTRGIGLAAVIERQLGGQAQEIRNPGIMDGYIKRSQRVDTGNAQTSAIDHPYKEKHTGFNNYQPRWDNAESFVQDIWPHARRAADQLGVSPDVLVAQSALETGWGKHVRYFSNGDNSFNLFGIKADKRWQGESISFNTLEFNDGAMQKQQARFRAYGSLAEAFNDYVDFIQTNPRYQPALEKAYNPAAFTQELQRAGYATDPDYAEKINRVRSSELIQSQVAKLKNSQQQSIL